MRQVVAYDDLSPAMDAVQPQSSSFTPAIGPEIPPNLKSKGPPPAKKRRRDGPSQRHENHPVQHWDDPGGAQGQISYEDDDQDELELQVSMQDDAIEKAEEAADESRELTYEEIWDDSALIDAWEAANEEYETMHGKNKSWKHDRVKNSPLWYNVPPVNLTSKSKRPEDLSRHDILPTPPSSHPLDHQDDHTSKPLDFNTFVPTHDASLAFPVPPHPPSVPGPDMSMYYSQMLPELSGSNVNADEAFSRALGAMYWGGYWTAMYHAQRRVAQTSSVDDDANESLGQDDGDDLVATQR